MTIARDVLQEIDRRIARLTDLKISIKELFDDIPSIAQKVASKQKRTMSPAARRRIAAAQRKRWKAWKRNNSK